MSKGFTGEYWIIDGEPVFADGEFSEEDHTIIAQHFIRNQILSELDIQPSDWPDLETFLDLIRTKLGDCSLTTLAFQLKSTPSVFLIPAALEISDARSAVMQYLGWKWVKRNWVATHNLSEGDRAHIVKGLNRIWDEEDLDETTGMLELRVQTTGRVFIMQYSELLQPDLFLGSGIQPTIYNPEPGFGWGVSLGKAQMHPAYKHDGD